MSYDSMRVCEGRIPINCQTRELIRSSTSVAANYRAARLAQSEASFVAKVSITIEEADESGMWIELIIDKNLLRSKQLDESKRLMKEASELTSILIATRKTINSRNKRICY